jgi:hypothetical protein
MFERWIGKNACLLVGMVAALAAAPPWCVGQPDPGSEGVSKEGHTAAAAAAAVCPGDQTSDEFAVSCASAGQLCSSTYAQTINSPDGVLELEYFVGVDHCSSVRVTFLVDGAPVATSPFLGWPGQGGPLDTGLIDVGPVAPGAHLIEVQAEGTEGGCNSGQLSAWGGRLRTVTDACGAPS